MDGDVRIWSLKNGQNLYTLRGHTSLVGPLSLSPNTLVSGAADATLRIWNPDTGALLHILQGHHGAVTCFKHDDFKVISGSDRTLKMSDTRDGTMIKELLADVTGVWQVQFNERFYAVATNDQEHTFLNIWDFGSVGDADVHAARRFDGEDESDDESKGAIESSDEAK